MAFVRQSREGGNPCRPAYGKEYVSHRSRVFTHSTKACRTKLRKDDFTTENTEDTERDLDGGESPMDEEHLRSVSSVVIRGFFS